MTRSFWFAMTVLVLICFLSAAVDWLAKAPAVLAMAVSPTVTPAEVEQQAQSLKGSPPVMQIVVALVLVLGLFGALSIRPLLGEKDRR